MTTITAAVSSVMASSSADRYLVCRRRQRKQALLHFQLPQQGNESE